MKSRTALIFVCILSHFGMVMHAQAEEAAPALMRRSMQTLKFEAQKATNVEISNRGGMLQKTDAPKDAAAVVAENMQQNRQRQIPSQPFEETFTVSSEFLAKENAYKLTVTEVGGVIISDKLLDEAPADGYEKSAECSLTVKEKAYEAKKYVYLRTPTDDKETPAQYTRLELDMVVGKVKLIMGMNAVTNPDGGRNLKYENKAQQKYIAQRLEEIEKAMKDIKPTPEQTEEMHELMMLQAQEATQAHGRWDFDGNRRRAMQEQRQRLLEADGRLRPNKRTIEKTD